MRTVFADTHYWIALANPKDEWHARAMEASASLQPLRIVTTDEVLVEFLAYFSNFGFDARKLAVRLVHTILDNANVRVVPQTHESFLAGFQLYESRLDEAYSLTDCVSMETMRAHHLAEVLTHDEHFAEEGFVVLVR
jgi:predicted nucleic acid-binding protein